MAGLKRQSQAEIIKKSVILFWLLDTTILCKHVHRLELQKLFNFSAAHLPVRLDIETKFPYFLFLPWLSIIRNQELCLYIQPNWWRHSRKIKTNFCSSSLWTWLHHMVIWRRQNKVTDFFMILAWACPFTRTWFLLKKTLCGVPYISGYTPSNKRSSPGQGTTGAGEGACPLHSHPHPRGSPAPTWGRPHTPSQTPASYTRGSTGRAPHRCPRRSSRGTWPRSLWGHNPSHPVYSGVSQDGMKFEIGCQISAGGFILGWCMTINILSSRGITFN